MLLLARYVLPVTGNEQFDVRGIENGAVLVRDGRIADVGHALELRRRYPTEETRDFGQAVLMPGFVDCRTRLEYATLRGITNDAPYVDWEAYILKKAAMLSPQDWEDAAILGAFEAVRSGITTVADTTRTGAGFHAMKAIGLRGIAYREVGSKTRADIETNLRRAVDDIESWGGAGGRIRAGIATEHLYTCHPEMLGAVARYATETRTPVCVDIAGSIEEYNFIKYGHAPFAVANEDEDLSAIEDSQAAALLPTGCSPVRYVLNWDILDVPEVLAVQCVKLDDDDIAHLAERDVRVGVCSRANAKLGMGVAPVAKMRAAGVTVGLGTGSVAACDSLDPFEEMRFTLLMQRASNGRSGFITGPGMVKMATLDSARALRMDDQVGSLEVGKLADVIAVDLSGTRQIPTHFPNSAVIHTAHPANVLMTMIGGEVVYDATDEISPLLTMDPREIRRILANTDRARAKLRQA